jgi:DNA topoisomerase-6 subunit B
MAEKEVAAGENDEFREHSVAEFFRKNRQMLGFSGKVRSLTTVVHEYATNSLDAAEEAKILPDIMIKIEELAPEHYRVAVQDNGPGIPKAHVGKALGMMLAGTKFHRYMQQRGQQGIGATGCTLYSQMTTGKPTRVKTCTGNGETYECEIMVDVKSNAPIVSNEKTTKENFRGTRVEAEFKDVKYDRSEHGAYEYVKRTALANPHAGLTLVEPSKGKVAFKRVVEAIPRRPWEIKPHPLGLSTDDLMQFAKVTEARKLGSFLVNDFSRISSQRVDELRKMLPGVNFDANPHNLQWQDAEALVKAFKTVKWIGPETDALIPIGEQQIVKALTSVLKPEYIGSTERKPKVFRGGVPFLVEAAIAYGGGAGHKTAAGVSGEIIRFANRAPLLFDGGGCAITTAVKSIDWKRYEISNFDAEPISVFVNLVSVHVPYSSAGKQAVSEEDEIIEEIRLAVMDAARRLQIYLHGKMRAIDVEEKKKAIKRYIKQLASDLTYLSGADNASALAKKLEELVEKRYLSDEALAEEEAEKPEEQEEEEKEE